MKTPSRWLKRIYTLPAEHGAWALWLGPLAIGIGVAGWNDVPTLVLVLAQLFVFLSRQPLVILVKALAGRRSSSDVMPALLWFAGYATLATIFSGILIVSGYIQLLLVVLPIAPMLVWQVWLIRERSERQMTIELAGSGMLALAAPTACYVATGVLDTKALVLWVLCWLQSAAAIVYVYLRLAQRRLDTLPSLPERWRMGRRAITYAVANLIFAGGLALAEIVPPLTPAAFAAMVVQVIGGMRTPAIGAKPQRIGLAQVGTTVIFAALIIAAYRV